MALCWPLLWSPAAVLDTAEGEGLPAIGDPGRTVERRRLDLSEAAEAPGGGPGAAPAHQQAGKGAAGSDGHGHGHGHGHAPPAGLPPLPPHHHAAAAHPRPGGSPGGGGAAGGAGRGAVRIEEAPSQGLLETPMPMELDAQLL